MKRACTTQWLVLQTGEDAAFYEQNGLVNCPEEDRDIDRASS